MKEIEMDILQKRLFTINSFFEGAIQLILKLPVVISARISNRLHKNFRKKLLLATSVASGCDYCVWFHSNMGLDNSMTSEELQGILQMQLGVFVNSDELLGILFAQHYAETNGNFESNFLDRLKTSYGAELARDILVTIKYMYFANLTGNTFSAFLRRIKGA